MKKRKKIKSDDYFYALVNLNNKNFGQPEFYIVPSKIVAERIKKNQARYDNDKIPRRSSGVFRSPEELVSPAHKIQVLGRHE